MSPHEELMAAVRWAMTMWRAERDAREWQVCSAEECRCTVQSDGPENVHLGIVFSCERHGELARRMAQGSQP